MRSCSEQPAAGSSSDAWAGLKDAARRTRFVDATAQRAMFLETELPHPNVYLQVIGGPEPKSTDSVATLFGNDFVVEVVDATTARWDRRRGHSRLTHYLYDRVPVDKQPSAHRNHCHVQRPIG
jgi:hypothetical protein